jgi:(p)ppGpp synthase/HD superfamily hydrolase
MTHPHDHTLLTEFERTLRTARPDLDVGAVMVAATFAAEAHRAIGQERKYVGGPYIVHPIEVAVMVARAGAGLPAIAAALLHDVVEDTERTLEDVESAFGAEIAKIVEALTDTSTPADGNRAARKAKDRARLAAAGAEAQTVKLADLISNSRSIIEHDRNFARVYLKEKAALLAVMTRGEPVLLEEARNVLAAGLKSMGMTDAVARVGM